MLLKTACMLFYLVMDIKFHTRNASVLRESFSNLCSFELVNEKFQLSQIALPVQ